MSTPYALVLWLKLKLVINMCQVVWEAFLWGGALEDPSVTFISSAELLDTRPSYE